MRRRLNRRPCRAFPALAAALLGAPAAAQHNLSFEQVAEPAPSGLSSWRATGDGSAIELDAAVAHAGDHSLRITHDDTADSARVTQVISPELIAGDRVRISGHLKTSDVTGAAALWLRLDGPTGFLYIDGMRDRGVTGTHEWTRHEVEAPLMPGATTITFGATLRGRGTLWIDDFAVEGFDTSRLPPASPAAARYVTAALGIMRQHSINRQTVDWPALTAATMDQARGATRIEDAYLAVRYALAGLGDGHSYLMTPGQSVALAAAPVSNARTGREPREPRGEMLLAGIGYVWLPGFAGGTPASQVRFADQLQRVVETLDAAGSCGWIVDLRDNTGGNLWPMLAGLGPLIGHGEIGAAVYPDGRRVPLSYVDGQARLGEYTQLRVSRAPYRPEAVNPPTAVLIGRSTASSGEVILTALRGRANTRSFGSATRGLSTGNRTFALSDGASIVLTVAATSDRAGRVYSGAIAPDEPVAADRADRRLDSGRGGTPLRDQTVVQAAVGWLRAQQACAALAASNGTNSHGFGR